ncbi:MAG: sigma-70 family RNA polymerase sigma factor [Clostridiaceae bacterium]|jgi:RNA polymerase sigma-70 factor (ECF subfamily)|nr:sigma-70 family RNA polymerase sigma factor [Clostridiaceae bacterium]
MGQNEQYLLKKAKAGDVAAFEELVENYQKKLFNLAYRIVGNPEDAADMVQEALIRIFRSIAKFKEQSSFSTWIYRITTNVCLDELRKRKNKKEFSLDQEIHGEDGDMKRQIKSDDILPDNAAEREELREIVNSAINSLPEDQRVVISLRDIQGLTYTEISQVLDCPEGTVKSRINRARNALKNVLSQKRELFFEEYVR